MCTDSKQGLQVPKHWCPVLWLFRGIFITEIGIVWILVPCRTKWMSEVHVGCLYVEEYYWCLHYYTQNYLKAYRKLNANKSAKMNILVPYWTYKQTQALFSSISSLIIKAQVRWDYVWDWVRVVSICILMEYFGGEPLLLLTTTTKLNRKLGQNFAPQKHSHRAILKNNTNLS